MRSRTAAEGAGERLPERDAVRLDRDVDVEAVLIEQDVTDASADQVDTLDVLGERLDGFEHGLELGQLPEGRREVSRVGCIGLLLGALAERTEQIAACHDADHVAVAHHGNPAAV